MRRRNRCSRCSKLSVPVLGEESNTVLLLAMTEDQVIEYADTLSSSDTFRYELLAAIVPEDDIIYRLLILFLGYDGC